VDKERGREQYRDEGSGNRINSYPCCTMLDAIFTVDVCKIINVNRNSAYYTITSRLFRLLSVDYYIAADFDQKFFSASDMIPSDEIDSIGHQCTAITVYLSKCVTNDAYMLCK